MKHYRESLVDLLRPIHPAVFIEVGVHKGALSEVLLKSFPDMFLYMVDPYLEDPQYPDQELSKIKASDRTALCGSGRRSLERTRSTEFANYLMASGYAGRIDGAFIDGCHEKPSVLADMNAYWPLIRPGGIFCGHDYGKEDIPGVTEAVDEWFGSVGKDGMDYNVADGHIWWVVKS